MQYYGHQPASVFLFHPLDAVTTQIEMVLCAPIRSPVGPMTILGTAGATRKVGIHAIARLKSQIPGHLDVMVSLDLLKGAIISWPFGPRVCRFKLAFSDFCFQARLLIVHHPWCAAHPGSPLGNEF